MTLYGPDVSNNNFGNDSQVQAFVAALPGGGFSWVEHKVSEGNYYKDPYWPVARDAAAAAGIPCIGYHYVTTNDATSQAQTWVANGGGTNAMLDFEANSGDINNFWNVVNAFNAAGVNVTLAYIPRWYWQQIGSPDLSALASNGIALISSDYPTNKADYASNLYVNDDGGDGGAGWAAYGNATPAIWQFTSSANVSGIPVDCNAYKGSKDDLVALLTGVHPVVGPSPKHVVLTVAGTGSDLFNTAPPQPAMIGQQLAQNDPDHYLWQPVGDYPAAMFPMGPSVTAGVQSLIYLTTGETYPGFNITPGPTYRHNSLILIGYSQGAMVVCQFIQWCYQFNRTDILSRIVSVAVLGNPQRLAGYASGNEFAGWPVPAKIDGQVTGGIAQATNANGCVNMVAEQMQCQLPNAAAVTHFWGEFVNTNNPDKGATELYANCPQGGPGAVEQSIFNAVQNLTPIAAIGVVEDLLDPVSMALAILNGFEFLAATSNADHYTYDPTPIYNFVALAGSQTPPFTV